MEEAVAQSKLLSVLHRAQAFPLAAEASSTAGTRRGGVESKLLVSVCIKLDAASLERSSIEYVLQLGAIIHEESAARTQASSSGGPRGAGYGQALLSASKIPEHQRYRPVPSPYNDRTANYTTNGPRDAVGATPLSKYLGIDDVDDPYDHDERSERSRDDRFMMNNDNRPSVHQDHVRERQNVSHAQVADSDMHHRGNGIVINSSPQHHHHHHHHYARDGNRGRAKPRDNGSSRVREPAPKLPAKSPSSSRLARAEAALAAMERKQQVGGVGGHNGSLSRSHGNTHDVLRNIDRVTSRSTQNSRPPKSSEYASAFDSPSMAHRGNVSQWNARQNHSTGYSDRRSSSLETDHRPPRYGGGGSFGHPQQQRENRNQRIPHHQQSYKSTPNQHSRKAYPSQQPSRSHHHGRAAHTHQQQVPGSKKKSFNEWLQNQSFQ